MSHLQHTRIQTHRRAWLVLRKRPPLSVRAHVLSASCPFTLSFCIALNVFREEPLCSLATEDTGCRSHRGKKKNCSTTMREKKTQARYMSSWIFLRTADFTELVFLEILNLPGSYLVHWFPERGLCGHVEIYYSVNFISR